MTFQFLLGKVRQKQCLTTTECGKWFQFLLGKVRQKKTKKGRCYVFVMFQFLLGKVRHTKTDSKNCNECKGSVSIPFR